MEYNSIINLEFDKILNIISKFAGSNPAKQKIKQLKPLTDLEQVKSLLMEVEDFITLCNTGLNISTGGLRDLSEIFQLLREGNQVLDAEDMLKIQSNVDLVTELKKVVSPDRLDKIQGEKLIPIKIISEMPSLKFLSDKISQCIDETGQILDSASSALSSIRKNYKQTIKDTEQKLSHFIVEKSAHLQDHFFTIRNDRYVVPVSASSKSSVKGLIHDQSSTGQTLFVEPLEFLPLNNKIAQLKLAERDEIKKIFIQLTAMTKNSINELQNQLENLVYLDMIKARAKFAMHYNANKPIIENNGDLILKNARHPLLYPGCTGLDIDLSKNLNTIIVTGPNGGGKTVALKTTGINVLLIQTGNYACCEATSQIPVFDQVLSAIGESQSIEESLSSFAAHLKRLGEILALCNSSSLILIDEICTGTDPAEGSALASGILKYLSKKGAYTIATSHYEHLKSLAFVTEGFKNGAMEFANNQPTFRFIMGMPGKSNALAISKKFGLPSEVLVDLISKEEHNLDSSKLLDAMQKEYLRAENLRKSYVQKITTLREKEKTVEKSLAQLNDFRKTRRDRLTEEFSHKLKTKLKELESIISLTRNAINNDQKTDETHQNLQALKQAHKKARQILDELQAVPDTSKNDFQLTIQPEQLVSGAAVIWKRNMAKGSIIRCDHKKNRAFIEISSKHFQVHFNELMHARAEKIASSTYCTPKLTKNEIDLRGYRAEEAIEKVEFHLKELSQSEADKAILIHGKGTGALKKAITGYLSNSTYRKKFRPGNYTEGEDGVTIVLLKPENSTEIK